MNRTVRVPEKSPTKTLRNRGTHTPLAESNKNKPTVVELPHLDTYPCESSLEAMNPAPLWKVRNVETYGRQCLPVIATRKSNVKKSGGGGGREFKYFYLLLRCCGRPESFFGSP